jgi:hypothetical protein
MRASVGRPSRPPTPAILGLFDERRSDRYDARPGIIAARHGLVLKMVASTSADTRVRAPAPPADPRFEHAPAGRPAKWMSVDRDFGSEGREQVSDGRE